MMVNKLFKRQKAEKGSGRTVKIKHLLLPADVVEDLKTFQECYEFCYSPEKDKDGNPIPIRVTYEQMLRRWMDNISRIDPDVAKMYVQTKKSRRETQERLAAGLGLTAEQLTANEAAFDPTFTENEPWKLRYYFEKDGEQVDAIPALSENPTFGNRFLIPFYAVMDGEEIMMNTMIRNGWTLMNELGCEIDIDQAKKICNLMKKHQN